MYSLSLPRLRKKIRKWEYWWNRKDSHDMKPWANSPKTYCLRIFSHVSETLWLIQVRKIESLYRLWIIRVCCVSWEGFRAVHPFYGARYHSVKMGSLFQVLQLKVEILNDLESKKVLDYPWESFSFYIVKLHDLNFSSLKIMMAYQL